MKISILFLTFLFVLPSPYKCWAQKIENYPFLRKPSFDKATYKLQKEQTLTILSKINTILSSPDLSTLKTLESVQFIPADQTEESQGQRILILEGYGYPASGILRYQKRLLGIYKLNQWNGRYRYEPQSPTLKATSGLIQISRLINSLSFHIPVADLYEIGENLYQEDLIETTISNDSSAYSLNHLERVFELLADFNPKAQFIISELPSIPICKINDPTTLKEIKLQHVSAAKELLRLIKDYQINYVNLSTSLSLARITHEYENHCRSIVPLGIPLGAPPDPSQIQNLLTIRHDFFKTLVQNAPHVLFIKALPNEFIHQDLPTIEKHSENTLVSDSFIQVGYVSLANANIPSKGTHPDQYLDSSQKPYLLNADIFVNSGFNEDQNSQDDITHPSFIANSALFPTLFRTLFQRHLGILSRPLRLMATSWAVPVTLSFINYLRQGQQWNDIKDLKPLLEPTGNAQLYDPIAHRHLELYRENPHL